MKAISPKAALVVIDVQEAWSHPQWGRRNNPGAEGNIATLLSAWRAGGRAVFHVKHDSPHKNSPLHPSHPGNAIKPEAAPLPHEPVIAKDVNSGFIGTDLEARLRKAGADELVLVGITTPHCVSTTARMAGNLGFTTFVVSDGVAAFELRSHDGRVIPPEDVHYHALAALNGEFADIVTTADVLAALDEARA